MTNPLIVFDDSSRESIVKALGWKVSEGGLLTDSKDNLIEDDTDLQTLKSEEFGGILQGSKFIIKKDKSALLKYFLNRLND